MMLNASTEFLRNTVLFFFKYIFKFAIIPGDLNVTHIVPLIKDKKKPTDDPDNLRPISISNAFAQISERQLLLKIPILLKTHQYQFGFKRKTSCNAISVCFICF
jgi:hypothetical protein